MRHGKEKTEALENVLQRLRALEQNQPQQPITSDVPPGMPLNPEKQAALEQLKQEHYEVTELPLPPCNYCAKGRIDHRLGYQLIICNDPRKYKKPTEVILGACQNCWKRREWWKEKRERETEDRTREVGQFEPEPEALESPNCTHLKNRRNIKSKNITIHGDEQSGIYIREETDKLTKYPVGTKLIYCMQFGDWKTLQFCLDCFKGGKSSSVSTDVAETEEQGDVDA
jgi:hypothetical protein